MPVVLAAISQRARSRASFSIDMRQVNPAPPAERRQVSINPPSRQRPAAYSGGSCTTDQLVPPSPLRSTTEAPGTSFWLPSAQERDIEAGTTRTSVTPAGTRAASSRQLRPPSAVVQRSLP